MTKTKFNIFIKLIIILVIAAVVFYFIGSRQNDKSKKPTIIQPVIGEVILTLITTGVIEPQNRLEIKPSIAGRVEDILVKEGDKVKTGEILAWMSSTERAALIDTARSQGEEALAYWQDVYKKTPIISPINAEVIVRSVEPGQTVAASEAILVLSDRLIINAQFDETDIARVRPGQEALITLDAYPDIQIEGSVDHIAYESEIVNNVTIYNVDILPKDVPEILRSGMSVTVEVIEKAAKDVLVIPSGAIHYDKNRQFALIRQPNGKIIEKDVNAGLNNDKTTEIISGLTADDNIILKDNTYSLKRKDEKTNPFMPSRR